MLSKMHSVQTSSVMQSLLIVFADLIQTEVYDINKPHPHDDVILSLCAQLESVVSFLSQVPDPTGKPALNFVMKEWCARHVRISKF